MIVYLVFNVKGSVVSAFINEDKAKQMALAEGCYTQPVHVQDAQSNPVRG